MLPLLVSQLMSQFLDMSSCTFNMYKGTIFLKVKKMLFTCCKQQHISYIFSKYLIPHYFHIKNPQTELKQLKS